MQEQQLEDLKVKVAQIDERHAEPVVNLFISQFGRDYRIEDHFLLCQFYFMAEKAGHRDALSIIDNMYNEKKHRAWGPLFKETEFLIELPRFIGDQYSKHDMAKFVETIAHLGDRMFAAPEGSHKEHPEHRMTQWLIWGFSDEEVERINYWCAGHDLSVRYAGAGLLSPTLRSSLDASIWHAPRESRFVVDVTVQDVTPDPWIEFDDRVRQAVADLNALLSQTRGHRLDQLPLWMNAQIAAGLKGHLTQYSQAEIFVTPQDVSLGQVEAAYTQHNFSIFHQNQNEAMLRSWRSHDAEIGEDVPSIIRVNLQVWATVPHIDGLQRESVRVLMPYYLTLSEKVERRSHQAKSLADLETAIFLDKAAKDITPSRPKTTSHHNV